MAFQHGKTNVLELNILMATENEPKLKSLPSSPSHKRVVLFFSNLRFESTMGWVTFLDYDFFVVQLFVELKYKLEDLKVLRRSPDLFNNVKIGQGQLPLILIKHILFYHIWGLQPFRLSDLKQSYRYSIKQPSDF